MVIIYKGNCIIILIKNVYFKMLQNPLRMRIGCMFMCMCTLQLLTKIVEYNWTILSFAGCVLK